MSKKAYIILGVLLLLIVVAGVSLVVLVKKGATTKTPVVTTTTTSSSTTNPTTPTTPTTSSTPTTATNPTGTAPTAPTTDALVARTTDQVISPILSFQGNQVWYFTAAGNLEQLDLASANLQKYVLPKTLTISSAIWSSQGSDFIIVSDNSDGSKTFNYYSSANKTFTTYPSNVKEVQFMPSGNQVVYVWDNGNGTSSLSISDPDLANHKQLISALPDADDTLVISPLGDHLLLYNAATPADNLLYLMAFSDAKLHVIKTGPENAAIWSNDGKHFVFNKYNPANPADTTLWSGSVSSSKSDTSLQITVPVSKLAFDSTGSTLYYAAPDSGATGTTSSSTSAQPTPDSLWSYTFSTSTKTEIFNGDMYDLNASNLLVSADGKTLYFVNGDGHLYSVVISE